MIRGKHDLAKPGTLRLVPADRRSAELRSDYDAMKEMIFGKAVDFGEIVAGLKALEAEINA